MPSQPSPTSALPPQQQLGSAASAFTPLPAAPASTRPASAAGTALVTEPAVTGAPVVGASLAGPSSAVPSPAVGGPMPDLLDLIRRLQQGAPQAPPPTLEQQQVAVQRLLQALQNRGAGVGAGAGAGAGAVPPADTAAATPTLIPAVAGAASQVEPVIALSRVCFGVARFAERGLLAHTCTSLAASDRGRAGMVLSSNIGTRPNCQIDNTTLKLLTV